MVQLYHSRDLGSAGPQTKTQGQGFCIYFLLPRENTLLKRVQIFTRNTGLQSPASLLNAEARTYKPILGLESYRHLQTTELIFRVCLIAQVNISFWYLKQPHRKDHIGADSCSSCLQSTAKNPDDSLDLVPSSSFGNKLVNYSTYAHPDHQFSQTVGQVCLPTKECDFLNSVPLVHGYK